MSDTFSSLTQWSQEHIQAVFEASTEQNSLKAIRETFSTSISATLNGKPLGFIEISNLILAMRKTSQGGLKIQWLQTVEVSHDFRNREGFLGGMYIIHGIYKVMPGSEKLVEYTRHKAVVVKIDSESTDCALDSRRIVDLSFVAHDFPVAGAGLAQMNPMTKSVLKMGPQHANVIRASIAAFTQISILIWDQAFLLAAALSFALDNDPPAKRHPAFVVLAFSCALSELYISNTDYHGHAKSLSIVMS